MADTRMYLGWAKRTGAHFARENLIALCPPTHSRTRKAYVAAGFRFGLAPRGCSTGSGAALDRRQTSGGEGVDSGALAARIGDDRNAVAAGDYSRN